MNTIELRNVGPVEHLSIPCPEGGGIVVLRGTNDIGKSETLEAIENAMTGRGKIDIRRGAVRGELDAFGVAIKVGKRTTRTGEAVVQSLEGKFSIEDLIDPKIKDPLAADAKRIKTLIQITGAKATPELFYDLLGSREEFDAAVSKATVETDDIVSMADKIKRDLESSARKEESQAEHAEGRARGALEAAAGVEVTEAHDSDELQRELENAIRMSSQRDAEKNAHTKAARAAQTARDGIEDAEARYSGRTVADVADSETLCTEAVEKANHAVRDAESNLMRVRAEQQQANNSLAAAIRERKLAEQHESTVAAWRQQLAESIPASPSVDEITAAADRLGKARTAVEQGAIVRKAIEHKADGEKHLAEANEHRNRAAKLRNAAKGTDDILSGLVASSGTPLRVEAGRLMVDTDAGQKTLAELSHGTRSRMALDIAIEAVGDHGCICLKQEFWEGIAPARRLELAEHVRGRGVLVFTAEASDDEQITPTVMD